MSVLTQTQQEIALKEPVQGLSENPVKYYIIFSQNIIEKWKLSGKAMYATEEQLQRIIKANPYKKRVFYLFSSGKRPENVSTCSWMGMKNNSEYGEWLYEVYNVKQPKND